MAWVGRYLKDHPFTTTCHGLVTTHQIRASGDEASIASLGCLVYCFLWSIRNNSDSKFANCHSKANLSYLQDGRGQSGGILFCSAASGTRVLLKYHGLTLLIDTSHPLTAKESSPVDPHVKKSIFTLYIFPGDFQLHIFLCTINN